MSRTGHFYSDRDRNQASTNQGAAPTSNRNNEPRNLDQSVRASWGHVGSPFGGNIGGGFATSGDLTLRVGHRVAADGEHDDGIYAGWEWDGAELRIETDRYGLYPLFVLGEPDSCTLSTCLSDLLERDASHTLDYDALSVFVRVGFFVGDDTPFADIQVLPPLARLAERLWHISLLLYLAQLAEISELRER